MEKQRLAEQKWHFHEVYYEISSLYARAQQEDKALHWLDKLLQSGYKDHRWLLTDFDLRYLRQSPAFRELMKKYFPGQVKD